MRWNHIFQRFVAVLILAISLSAYGCKDSVSVSEDVQVPLSSLTVTPGALQPAFFSNTTSYIVDVSTTVTSVTVKAGPRDSTTTMTINGADTKSGQGRPIPLSPSGTTTSITIVLTNQNGIESTYDITVRKVANTLSALSVNPGPLVPAFTASTLTYQVDVGSGVTSVTVVATKTDPHAVMSGSVTAGPGVATGKATIPLNGPGTDTLVSITVAVPNGEAKTYTITVHRALSDDNNLSALSITPPGSFPPPGFVPSTLNYAVDVATDVTQVTVSATKSDPNAVLSGSVPDPGTGVATGQAPIQLDGPGTSKVVSITVTAPNGDFKTYTVMVNRAASGNNNLSALTVTPPGAFPPPGFAPSILDYTVDVATDVTQVTVSATKSDPNAVLSGSVPDPGTGVATGQAPIQLDGPGTSKVVSITVTAPNGDFKTYTVMVNRAASNDNNLSALSLTAGNVPLGLTPPFDQNHLDYTVEVPFGVINVTVTATKSDPDAVLSGSVSDPGPGQATGQATITFILLPPPQVSITVTAPDESSKTYTVTVNQAPAPPLSP